MKIYKTKNILNSKEWFSYLIQNTEPRSSKAWAFPLFTKKARFERLIQKLKEHAISDTKFFEEAVIEQVAQEPFVEALQRTPESGWVDLVQKQIVAYQQTVQDFENYLFKQHAQTLTSSKNETKHRNEIHDTLKYCYSHMKQSDEEARFWAIAIRNATQIETIQTLFSHTHSLCHLQKISTDVYFEDLLKSCQTSENIKWACSKLIEEQVCFDESGKKTALIPDNIIAQAVIEIQNHEHSAWKFETSVEQWARKTETVVGMKKLLSTPLGLPLDTQHPIFQGFLDSKLTQNTQDFQQVMDFLKKDPTFTLDNIDEKGNTLLLRSIAEGDLKIATLLLQEGANPLITNLDGLNAKTLFYSLKTFLSNLPASAVFKSTEMTKRIEEFETHQEKMAHLLEKTTLNHAIAVTLKTAHTVRL